MDKNKNVLIEHDYDGIQVMNERIPAWCKNLFYLSIVFAIVYLSYFHVLDIGKLPQAEYMKEMDPTWHSADVSGGLFSAYRSPIYDIEDGVTPYVREQLQRYVGANISANDLIMYSMSRSDKETLKKLRATFPGLYDQLISGGLIKMKAPIETGPIAALKDEASLAAGNKLFLKNCASCHAPDGGGIVGPNLTDDYWIHGAGIEKVVKITSFGNPSKGMLPWRGTISKQDILKVSSFILTLHGLSPQISKAPEGDKVEYPLPEDQEIVVQDEPLEEQTQ